MKKITKNLEETQKLAKEFVDSLNAMKEKGQINKEAIVIALFGDLGSGKTSFVQAIAKNFNIKEGVISPTFVIQKNYPIKNNKNFKNLIHIDAYRLDNPEEILTLGWHELVKNENNLIFVEWPEKIGDHIPKGHKKIYFEFLDPETRSIDVV
ncbi:MAG: tRNA (adenosine(37)-N6)-threonylcarbamoyltransferase complex ATPase subunit type 1 TsaE [bacterium]